MSYVDGFVLPVPKDNLAAYKKIASTACSVWMEHGALDYKECLLEDASGNEFTSSFPKLFAPKDHETIVFAYIVFKDRVHRDAVNQKVMADPRMKEAGCDNVFDSLRMAYSGFEVIVDSAAK